jgi:uncharacterized membrane protein YozB (DUF420 family)
MCLLAAHFLAHLNALLNATAAALLVFGYILIQRKRERAHALVMVSAFAVSVAFLISYVAYHFGVLGAATTHFAGQGPVRIFYFTVLTTHIVLAALVPFLALITIYFGLRTGAGSHLGVPGDLSHAGDRMAARRRHRLIARWTFPVWLYVSVTGVIVYLMLYGSALLKVLAIG